MNPELSKYLSQTAKAVQQLFDAGTFYRDLLDQIFPPMFEFSGPSAIEREGAWNEWCARNQNRFEITNRMQKEFLGQMVSQSVISGSILQIACMGIRLFSHNTVVPSGLEEFEGSKRENVKFFVGRQVNSLPLGIVILAARNQYSHMDEDPYKPMTQKLFARLYCGAGYPDPAVLLADRGLTWYLPANVFSLIGWSGYDSYLDDMRQMLE